MIKKEQITNINSDNDCCIYTNDEKTLLEEMNIKLKENIMTSYKAYEKYYKNIQKNINELQFYVNKNDLKVKGKKNAEEKDFNNISVDKYVSKYMNIEDASSLLYFFYMKTYYCPKCNRLKSFSGVHEKLECCGIDKVVVNVSTKMNDTAILKKVGITNQTVFDFKSKTLNTIKRAEVIVEGDDIYKVIKTKNNKYKSNGYHIVKDGEVMCLSKLPLKKDDVFIIVDDEILKMPYLYTIVQLDKEIINKYKKQNDGLDVKTLYSNLYRVLQAWKSIQEITPENILTLSLIYEHGLLSQITHSFALSNNILDMDTDVKNMFKYNKLGFAYFMEELNVLINVINSLLPNDDVDDVLNQINNNKLMKDICLKHKTKIDNIINKKVVFQTIDIKNEFCSLLMFNYYEDIETLAFIFSKIIKTHRLTSSRDMVLFIQTLNRCKRVNRKIEWLDLTFGKYSNEYLDNSTSCAHEYDFHISSYTIDSIGDMSKVLNFSFFFIPKILHGRIYNKDDKQSILELSDRTVSKIIKHSTNKNEILNYLIPTVNDSKMYYISWFTPDVLEKLLSDHVYVFTKYDSFHILDKLVERKTDSLKITQSMDLKDALNFLTYFSYSNHWHYSNDFFRLYQTRKITTNVLKTIFVNNLTIRFIYDFERLKSECEELFPELVGRKINYDRIIMEHDYYMQRRREGTVDMTSVFNDRYIKFKSFNMNVEGCKYIVEAPREVKDLIHEGLTQNHCMDSYGKNIESGQEMVLFVRLKRGEPLYAVSLDINGNVVQSSGEAHSAVPGEILAQIQREFANDKAKMKSIEHFFNCRKK